jgi:hypothetical protein
LVGVFFSIHYRKKGIVKEVPQFSETDFDLLFDEDGNYSPPENEKRAEEES